MLSHRIMFTEGITKLKQLAQVYSSDTTTLVQTLSSKREKYNKYQCLLLKTDMHESFVPGRYQDAHEYYNQLINNLTELFDTR